MLSGTLVTAYFLIGVRAAGLAAGPMGGFNRAGTAGETTPVATRNVSVNPSTHFHVNAIDGQSAASFFQNNHKHIMTAVDRAVRHGSALGLRTFTR